MKNALIPEAESVNVGTKFIIRDTAHMGEHTEKCLYLRLKQGGDAHPERKDAGVLLSERECRKEPIKSFMWSSSSFLFPHLTYPGTLLWVAHAPLNQEGSLSEGFWEERDSLRSGLTP